MKFVMQGVVTVPDGETIQNILTGQRYERPPADCFGTVYCCGSDLGFTAEINVSGRSISPPVTVNDQNRLPVVPDDMLIDSFEIIKDGLIQLTVANPTNGDLDFYLRVELEVAEAYA